jgi:peptidoglycan/LPS O-acetylase OafA/YrhL
LTVSTFPKSNNLDLLRLFFAVQVVLTHTAGHMGLPIPNFLGSLPGVPAFFFVSGFLIYAAYVNSPGKNYIYNRFLRLFPGLFFAVVIGGGG